MLINKNFNLQNLLENFDYDVDFWLRPLGLFDYFKFRNNTSNHKIMNFDIIWRHKENFLYSRFNYEDTVYISNKFGGVNYAALNKEDGCRESFVSRFEQGSLLEMDFDAYHPRLIADIIGYEL